jgi:transposase
VADNYRAEIATSSESTSALAERFIISKRSVQRYRARFRTSGSAGRLPRAGGRALKLDDAQQVAFLWFTLLFQDAPLATTKSFMERVGHVTMSRSLVCDYFGRFGFTSKVIKDISINRDEEDRVAFMTNLPTHPLRPGIHLINHLDFVDMDEMGFQEKKAKRGHMIVGLPAWRYKNTTGKANVGTIVVAVDARQGVVAYGFFEGGTTSAVFYTFLKLGVFPKIALTGSRVLTCDNLNAHTSEEVKNAVWAEGHKLILRPKHSPDFGPVEWVFAYIRVFLEHHSRAITKENLPFAIRACFDLVTPQLVARFMADAHFFVPGLPFKPYTGMQF